MPVTITTERAEGSGESRNGVTTVFVYNGQGQLAAEYSSQAAAGPGGTSYVMADHLGSTRLVTKADGTVRGRHDYLPFGEEIGTSYGGRSAIAGYGAIDLRHKFTQKERDSESNLDYFGARYFSGAQGRFSSADAPFADQRPNDPQSWSLYAYTRNNPLRFVDPSGRECVALDGGRTGDDGKGTLCSQVTEDDQKNRAKPPAQNTVYGHAWGDPLFGGNIFGHQMAIRSDASQTAIGVLAGGSAVLGVAGGAAAFYGGLTAGSGLIQLGSLDAIALDTNALIAVLETQGAVGDAVFQLIGKAAPIVSRQAAKEFLAKGSVDSLRAFLVSRGGGIAVAGSSALVQSLVKLGLKPSDAQVAASALQAGVKLITQDKSILRNLPGTGVGF
ncbi:MAG: RHS repeat-associated core domain-containing protein [Acidobacteriota bacterium]